MNRIAIWACLVGVTVYGQTAWPSQSWATATALTAVMNPDGLLDLSGLHWNPETNRLYAVQDNGRLRVLQCDASGNSFTQIASKPISGGPEGITQANLSANEFYTIDENSYNIRKYTHTANFSSVTESKHWNLLLPPSPMPDTGNTGPEGIVFVPDAFLSAAGFTSAVNGQPYTSVKGAGGLFFIAHQNGGYIWVYDINLNTNNDFAFVGKYKTGRSESCDLAFDRSTGLMYILHNVGANYLEVTDLSLAPATGGEPAFTKLAEYFLSNPVDGNFNVEGFALMPKCGDQLTGGAFVCRDVESDEDVAVQQDSIRWFEPFVAAGTCAPLQRDGFDSDAVGIFPNPVTEILSISFADAQKREIIVYDLLGQSLLHFITTQKQETISVADWAEGVYLLEIHSDSGMRTERLIKS